MCAWTGRRRRKDLISGRDSTQCDDVGLDQNRSRVQLRGQWKGSSDPNAPSEIVDTMAEEAPRVDSVAVGDKSQISIKTGASPNQHEIERRREIVRQFFNDFWVS